MEALIALEKKVRRGKTTLTLEEYEHWGDYDGPAVEEGPAAQHVLTKEELWNPIVISFDSNI